MHHFRRALTDARSRPRDVAILSGLKNDRDGKVIILFDAETLKETVLTEIPGREGSEMAYLNGK